MFHNYTPHKITIITENGKVELPSQGVIRVSTTKILVGHHCNIPIYETIFGNVELPESFNPENIYIVSRIVKDAMIKEGNHGNLDNILVPGELVRDENGNIIGCKGLSR